MLNHITIMGRLTRDPELRYTQSQTPVASFTLAVDRDLGSRDGGEKQTDFIDCVACVRPRSSSASISRRAAWPLFPAVSRSVTGPIAMAASAAAQRSSLTICTSGKAAAATATAVTAAAVHTAAMAIPALPERAALPLLPPLRSWMTATASCRSKILIGGYSFGFR